MSYRPGARFGPAHIRESSRLLRPYNPALAASPFAAQQVADAGDLGGEPVQHRRGHHEIERGARDLLERVPASWRWAATTPSRCPCSARWRRPTGRWRSCTSTLTWIPGTPTSARRTRTGPRFAGPRGGPAGPDRAACTSGSAARCTRRRPGEDGELGFQVVSAPELEDLRVARLTERIAARVGGRPVYVSVDIDVLDPAHAPGTGTPEAGGLTSRELLAALRSFAGLQAGRRGHRRGRARLRPRADHRDRGRARGYELLSALALGKG